MIFSDKLRHMFVSYYTLFYKEINVKEKKRGQIEYLEAAAVFLSLVPADRTRP